MKHIIGSLRERICGPKNLRKVCCPRSQDKVNELIGSFQQKLYGVNGDVYILDSQSFLIKNFQYTGEGPDGVLTGRFDGQRDLIVTLPEGTNTEQISWLSVWCRDFGVNFGHATLRKKIGDGY